MRTELISAELYTLPSLVSTNSRKVYVACGEYLLVYSLKTGKLIEVTDEILSNPTSLALVNSNLAVSDDNGSRSFSVENDVGSSLVPLSPYPIVARCGLVTVFRTAVSTLAYVVGDLSSQPIQVHSGAVLVHVSCSEKLICGISGSRTLFVFDIEFGTHTEYKSESALTCTAVHEKEVVTGEVTGRIVRWNNMCVLHWHATPVSSLAFTSNGSVLLSGGEEGVVCMWTRDKGQPQFIPRLGGAIVHITLSNNQFAAVSLKTNRIVIIDLFTRAIHTVIHGMVTNKTTTPVVANTSVAILDETRTSVQFFNPSTRREESVVALSSRNYLPQSLQRNAIPWSCSYFAVSGQSSVCAAMERNGEVMMRFVQGTVCMLPKGVLISGLVANHEGGFISLNSSNELFLWEDSKIAKRVALKQKPNFFGISQLLFIAFEDVLTVWNPLTLVQITSSCSIGEAAIVFVGLFDTNCFVVQEDGQISVLCLKKCKPIASCSVLNGNGAYCVFKNRLFINTKENTLVCVLFEHSQLTVEHIEMKAKVNSLVALSNSVLVGMGGTFVRIDIGEQEEADTQASDVEEEEVTVSEKTQTREREATQRITKIRGTIFPIDLEEIPSPENAFFMMIDKLVPKLLV